jgi:hypothetical protein
MFSNDLKRFLIEILTSWQVIVAAVAVTLYILLVSYVTRFKPSGKAKTPPKPKVKREKKKKEKPKEEEEAENEDEILEEE